MATFDSVRTQLRHGIELLRSSSHEAQKDAALLLSWALGKDRAWLLTHPDVPLTAIQITRYTALLARRAEHEPMQYILGEQEFYGLRLRVTPDVLIPRPETEHLVEAILNRSPKERALRIADVGTGSGAIAIALASALPLAMIDALEISEAALAVARINAEAHGVSERLFFHHSDLLEAVQICNYDVVVSNPPYVSSTETLEAQVQHWEPHGALFAGPDGLDAYRRLLPQSLRVLRPGSLLAMEFGAGQQPSLQALFSGYPEFEQPTFLPDLQGLPRVVLSRRKDDSITAR